MPRLSRDTRFETRQARGRLKAKHEPYWRQIYPGLFIGYRKGQRGGVWFMRRLHDGQYTKRRLAVADDHQDANGIDVLDYQQAHTAALKFADDAAKLGRGMRLGPYTVDDALTDYLEWYQVHKKAYGATKAAIDRHIRPAFEGKKAAELTTLQIRRWHEKLATDPKAHGETGADNDAKRKRKATANRVLTILKAALNHAWRDGHVESDTAWRKVKPFHGVDAPKIRYLNQEECARLINAADAEFRPLVRAALFTGCRYGELTRMQCADFNPDAGTVTIRESKGGKARHVPLTDEGRQFFEDATAGQLGNAFIFTKADGSAWGPSQQIRRMAQACQGARIAPAASFHVLRHSYGSLLAMRGVPLQVIAAAMGHSDTRMTERHYAHLMPSYIADTIRANLPSFGGDAGNVTPLKVTNNR